MQELVIVQNWQTISNIESAQGFCLLNEIYQ